MNNVPLQALLLLLAFASTRSLAGEGQFHPVLPEGSKLATEQAWIVPLAPHPNLFSDFGQRLKAAIDGRNLDAVLALYQTNGATAETLGLELAQWRQILADDTNAKVHLFGKELSTLPAEARKFWSEQAHHLTKHEVTHLVLVQSEAGVSLTLPLVVVDGRLLIVPSDARATGRRIEPSGPANGSQRTSSETNRTSSAAGSRR